MSGRFSTRLGSGQLVVLGGLLLSALCGSSTVLADEYSDQWGPPSGSRVPVLEAYDQAGILRTLDNLSGENGLLLVFSRSADW